MEAGQRAFALADLDAVTLDAYGTLDSLDGPVDALATLLPDHDRDSVRTAFRAEAAYYADHAHEGADAASLSDLRERCTRVFNGALGSALTPEQFVGALRFRFLPGALEAVRALRRRGLALAVVTNADVSAGDRFADLAIPVVTSAEAGAPKPDPAPLLLALRRLGISPDRALHVGDTDADARAAAAAGMRFAAAPLDQALAAWT